MTLRLDFDGIADGTTMAQASTLVPVTKMKKAQAWMLALSWGSSSYKKILRHLSNTSSLLINIILIFLLTLVIF